MVTATAACRSATAPRTDSEFRTVKPRERDYPVKVSDFLVGVGFAVLAAVGLAVQSLAVRLGTRTHSISSVIGVMFAVNLLVLLPVAGISAYPDYNITPVSLGAFAVSGILGSLLARYCYFVGIARLGASRTEPLKALLPLFAVGAAVVVLDEQVTVTLLAGVVLLIAGGVAVTLESRDSPATPTGRQLWVSLAFPLTAALLLGIDPIFTKLGFAEGTSALVGVTIRVAAAAAGFGLYLLWQAVRGTRQDALSVNRWLIVASVANTVYLLAYFAALARTPVSVVTPVLGTSTLFVVGGAAMFLQDDEHVTARLIGATVLVVAGVVFVVQG
ncbi:DMT family transporter [Haloarcula sp. 1CSR25-25]|uniref:DMT family transporter n=1 Tax=Haloarcula sp. 1CSR25-25 TaxID=2862545 RepID=UPI0028943135|nr:DMT family transporter [Haloarcula sp. 1CSR25-25]MDT3434893.1 DMT family transporter [Haloarcula sp. 1CSR25-25]